MAAYIAIERFVNVKDREHKNQHSTFYESMYIKYILIYTPIKYVLTYTRIKGAVLILHVYIHISTNVNFSDLDYQRSCNAKRLEEMI